MEDQTPLSDLSANRRGGRRRKPESDRLASFIRIRVKPGERMAIEARAASAGLSLTEYARAAIEGDSVTVIVSQTAPPEVIQQLRLIGINLRQGIVAVQRGCFTDLATEAAAATVLIEAGRVVSAELWRMHHGSERH